MVVRRSMSDPLADLEAVEAMFPGDFTWLEGEAASEYSRFCVEVRNLATRPDLSLTVFVSREDPGEGVVPQVSLVMSDFLEMYREELEVEMLSGMGEDESFPLTAAFLKLQGKLNDIADSLPCSGLSTQKREEEPEILEEGLEGLSLWCRSGFGGDTQLGRRLLFSHHIIASSKRKAVCEWAVELRLAGMSKIGWPGLILVEGPESSCGEYVRRLQRLRWKHLVVRGEQIEEPTQGASVDDLRKLPLEFREFGPDQMGLFAQACRDAGLEELFLTSMKIYGGKKRG